MIRPALTLLAGSILAFSAPAIAQETEHDHNHDHKTHTIAPADIDIDHVFDEAPDDHTIGSTSAPVSMVIYASVTCPHCSDWFTNEWPALKSNHVDTGNLRVTFREFPTAPAQVAMIGFTIANCAPKNLYFDQIEKQMVNQKDIFAALQAGQGVATYESYMGEAGLDTEAKRQACFEEEAHFDRIDRSMKRAQAGGIGSVPAFILNGEVYKGDSSAAEFDKIISEQVNVGFTPIPTP